MAEALAYSCFRLYITKSVGGSDGYTSVGEWRMWENYAPSLQDADFMVGGVASASGVSSPSVAANAFDKNTTTTWESPSVAGPKWLRYDLPAPKKPKAIFVQHSNWPAEAPADFILQGSNDGGTTWSDIQAFSGFLTAATAPAGRLVTVGSVQVGGTALLSDGRPASRVLLQDYETGALIDKRYPDASGRYMFYPDTAKSVLVTILGPAGYRPVVEGPLTPLVVAAQ